MCTRKTNHYRKIIHLVFILILGLSFYALILPKTALAATLTWDGGGSTNDWSEDANWTTNTEPVAGDTAVFDNTSDKNATIDAVFPGLITTVNVNSGYDGVITQARSLTIATSYTQASGSFTASNQAFSTANFSLTAGVFTAPSVTMTWSNNVAIAGGTFNNNGGTVSFTGGSSALSNCTGVTFNAFTMSGASGAKTIASGCSLPLGANPTIPNGMGLSGTLTGSGTITLTTGTSTFSAGAALTGFSGISGGGAFQVSGATLDLSTYTTFSVSNAFIVNSGSFTSPTAGMSVLSFTLGGGTFTAPSGTMSINGAITISGTPTFNANGGTVAFISSSNVTVACGSGVTFNLVSFATGIGQKSTSGVCNFPLGSNPSIAAQLAINATSSISGTGTLTYDSTNAGRALSFNSPTATISGFSGIQVGNVSSTFNTFIVGTGLINLSSYTTAVFGSVQMTGGSLTLPNNADINGNLNISGGSFTAPSGTMSIAGAVTITNYPSTTSFNANNGTITIDGGSAALACNNVTFNLVNLAPTSGTKTIGSECIFPLGTNPASISAVISLSGRLTGSGTLAFTSGLGTFTMNTGSTLGGFSRFTGNVLNISGATIDFSSYTTFSTANTLTLSSGSLTLPNNSDINAGLVISGGTFNAPSGTMNISGALSISNAPTFNANGGTLVHTGTSFAIATSIDLTLNNLYKINESTAVTPTFSVTAGRTLTVLGELRLVGTNNRRNTLNVNSSAAGSVFYIDARGPRQLESLTVRDSNNINALVMTCGHCVDLGNNTNWFFSDVSTLSLLLEAPSDTVYINTDRPTFKWRAASSSVNAGIVNYAVQMDNGSDDTNWEILDIPAYQNGGYSTPRYRVTYEGFDDDNPNNNYLNLTTTSSNEWSPTQFDGRVKEGRHSWKVSAFDTVGNSTRVNRDILLDTARPTVTFSQVTNASKNKAFVPTFTTAKRQPTFFGVILDPLAGSPTDKQISSGPKQVDIRFLKKNFLGLYLPYDTAVHTITQMTWANDTGLVNDNFQNTSAKYSNFGYTPTKALQTGTYKVILRGQDNVDNASTETEFFLVVR